MNYNDVDLKAFAHELTQLKKQLQSEVSIEDYKHLKKIIWTNRIFLILGYGTAWIIPNPLSMILISLSLTAMWVIVAHHVSHRGYDNVPFIPKRYTSKNFAKGWRRFIDWSDWIYPPAWEYEHNVLHHFYTNESLDPDQISYKLSGSSVENQTWWKKILEVSYVILKIISWKASYYSFNTLKALGEKTSYKQDYNFTGCYLKTFLYCYLPYILVHYVLIPLPFLLISNDAYIYVLINRLGAEILTNIHTFAIIVPNHIGGDLRLNNKHYKNQEEFYIAQILSSCNYKTGGYWNDYMHGYLNYQIEHHLFPSLSALQYTKIQPKVKALCDKYKVPYIQESAFVRISKLIQVLNRTSVMGNYS